jgi:hypothetical protein
LEKITGSPKTLPPVREVIKKADGQKSWPSAAKKILQAIAREENFT